MKITSNTKISELIKANAASIEAIASINKHFEKLRNPILRKILAPRVTIADAAKIGDCSVEDFFQKLIPLGFATDVTQSKPKREEELMRPLPDFMKLVNDTNTTVLDVRNGLASGKDPFNEIMQTVSSMPSENALLIINTFEPIPLIRILQKKGFEYCTIEKENKVIYTYLKRTDNKQIKNSIDFKKSESTENEFATTFKKYKDKIVEIDVRNLEMPLPMITILSELESLPKDSALFVNHKKIPQFLFPELIEKKFNWLINEIASGDVKILIYK